MKTGFSLWEILHRENPVFITGMGLQWGHIKIVNWFLNLLVRNVIEREIKREKVQMKPSNINQFLLKIRAFWYIICLCSCSEQKGHQFLIRSGSAVRPWNMSMKMGTKTLLAYCASIHKCPYLSLIHKKDMNIDLGKIANLYNTILVRSIELLLRDSIWE